MKNKFFKKSDYLKVLLVSFFAAFFLVENNILRPTKMAFIGAFFINALFLTLLVLYKSKNSSRFIEIKSDIRRNQLKSQALWEAIALSALSFPLLVVGAYVLTLFVIILGLLVTKVAPVVVGLGLVFLVLAIPIIILMSGWEIVAFVARPLLSICLIVALYLSFEGSQNPEIQNFLTDWWMAQKECVVPLGDCADVKSQAEKFAPFGAFAICFLVFSVFLMPTAVSLKQMDVNATTLKKQNSILEKISNRTKRLDHDQQIKRLDHNQQNIQTSLKEIEKSLQILLKRHGS